MHIVSVFGYIYSLGLFSPVAILLLGGAAYTEGILLFGLLVLAPLAFCVGWVPPILHCKMLKTKTKQSVNNYAEFFLLCYLFCTLTWAIYVGATFSYLDQKLNFYCFLVTPFVLANIYGFFVIKEYGKQLDEVNATH